MKKLLIFILIIVLAGLTVYIAWKGIAIGKFELLGIEGLDAKNADLDQTIEKAERLINKDYVQVLGNIEINTRKLQQEKRNYEDITEISAGEDIDAANQIEKYEYDSLMIKLGRHATQQGADLSIDVETGNTAGVYNLNFQAEGRYISIIDFISAIENDSTLGFKIEDFKMIPMSSGTKEENQGKVCATFSCKTIAIEKISEIEREVREAEEAALKEAEEQAAAKNTKSTTSTKK